MKCVNAVWEIRNLGVRTIEIEIEKTDALEKILSMIEDFRQHYDAKYVVIKSDSRYPAVSILLQQADFLLIENQIGLKLNREDALKAFAEYKDFHEDIAYKLADEQDKQLVFAELAKGIFKTDRVALDPRFGLEIANRRYAFWMKDALSRGAQLHLSIFQNKPIGFFLSEHHENKSYGLLAGIFNGEEAHLQGALSYLASLKCFIDGGRNIDKTFVSSNNLDVLRLQLALGRKITNIRNVFVKHYD